MTGDRLASLLSALVLPLIEDKHAESNVRATAQVLAIVASYLSRGKIDEVLKVLRNLNGSDALVG